VLVKVGQNFGSFMNKVRFLTSGESHGKGLLGIIDGIPAGVTIDETYINFQLKRRQGGTGRSNRMKLESDTVEIYGGVRKGKTIGAPIGMIINNVDYREVEKVTVPRPGHADLAGMKKFWFDDIRDVSERASARETAMRVALCSVCMKVLEDIRVDISSKVDERYVMEAKSKKDTVGGLFEITVENLPYGLGSYTHWDKKINAELTKAVSSINGVKGVEIGMGFEMAEHFGSEVHDEIFEDGNRLTNNAGGIEGGMTNAQPLIIRGIMKPISTLMKPLKSIDMETNKPVDAFKERSDTSVVTAASVIAEGMVSFVILDFILEKFGGDSLEQLMYHMKRTSRW